MASPLTRKIGPLPAWAWGILGGIAVYFLYTRYKSSSANAAANSPIATTLDPSAVDPATGLTYGQELAGGFPTAGGLQGAADSATSTPSFDSQLQDFATLLGDFGGIAGQLGFTPPQPSDTTLGAAASAPLDNTSPVATEAGVTAGQVRQIINKALKGKTIQTKNPASHRAKTIHAAHPQGHQHKVTKPKSTAKPRPIHRPAGGGHPGGTHARPPARPAPAGRPVHRGGPPVRKVAPKPPPRRRHR